METAATLGAPPSDKAPELSDEDWKDLVLAHRYRIALPSKPRQSSFRVLALIFYDIPKDDYSTNDTPKGQPILPPWIAQTTADGQRNFVVGTNDEPGFMGGAICAERAALVQFRFLPSYTVTKIVISTDSVDPITPGLLCREFLAGHPTVPWDVPVITGGSSCMECHKKDADLFAEQDKDRVVDACSTFSAPCAEGRPEHSLRALKTSIRELYPYPSPYTRLTSKALGEQYSARATADFDTLEEADSKRLLELAILEAKSNISDLHPIQFGAAAIFEDGTIVTTRQASALEYGCTLDAVSQLAPHFEEQDSAPVLLVQADQFGIAHAPFADARAFLTEHDFENCQIVVHDAPVSDNDEGVFDIDRWTLKEVFASELASKPPSWTEGTER
eukprot:CAMPEP_0176017490 /NCGR_PEP_ID=MMETSP0120_2-20121206/8389_1 /TAXON_ID=160619 /ORGANISM="Kryptoperidinium foliaceum, Strain CCMP 1326" /LENGTH=388 /DNA_ID=CAMNT_0017350511 /DNA_START=135 /DNA_END=1305 /DNA_ORIENTATION=-